MDSIKRIHVDDFVDSGTVDVTERVTCYENGKTFECDCGQGIGIVHEQMMVVCASCGKACVDHKADEREPPEREEGQSSILEW